MGEEIEHLKAEIKQCEELMSNSSTRRSRAYGALKSELKKCMRELHKLEKEYYEL